MTKKTDDELLQRVKKQDKKAFETLFSRYEKPLYNYVHKIAGRRDLAEEILQETFTRIWFSAHLYKSRGSAVGWIYTIARNTARNEMAKKEHRYLFESCPVDLKDDAATANLEKQFELHDMVMQALQSLTPPNRELLVLKHFQQLKFREIAEITNTPESTIKSRYKSALLTLRKVLHQLSIS